MGNLLAPAEPRVDAPIHAGLDDIATAPPRPEPRPPRRRRRPAVEIAAAVLALAAITLVLRPGVALAGVAAAVVIGARVVAWAAVGAWRHALTGSRRAPRRRGGAGRRQRVAAVVTIAASLTLVVAAFSYIGAVTRRSNSSFAIRTVEWMRDNGAAALVSEAESFFYTINAPSKGGPALRELPLAGVGSAGAGGARQVRVERPPSVRPVMHPRIPGEGLWRATQARFARSPSPPVLVTTYRPDPSYPRTVAGLAWINPRHARVSLYAGLQEPPGGASAGPNAVPATRRGPLLATFNSGFKHSDGAGGYFAQGRLFQPLQPGMATVIGTADGRIDVRSWRGGSRPGPGVVFARQNLPLIVDHGRPSPNLSTGPMWGTTVGGAVMVWRSGVGVDRRGDLIYAAAPEQTVHGLARVLAHAGALRAMELDINSYWVTLNTYRKPGARGAHKLLAGMTRPARRYLSPDDRDFFAVTAP
jgi:hypothetical protein